MMISNRAMVTDHPQAWILAGLIIVGGASWHFCKPRRAIPQQDWRPTGYFVTLGSPWMTNASLNEDWGTYCAGAMIWGIARICLFVALIFPANREAPEGIRGRVHGGGFPMQKSGCCKFPVISSGSNGRPISLRSQVSSCSSCSIISMPAPI
jgi:hypothetical protein